MKWVIGFVLAALLGTMAATVVGYLVIGDQAPSAATRSGPSSTVVMTSTTFLPSGTVSAPNGPTTIAAETNPTTTGVVGYTLAELGRHASTTSCWLLIGGRVYDVTTYLRNHPGGARTITPWCGKEATRAFATEDGRGEHSTSAYQLLEDYYIGNLVL